MRHNEIFGWSQMGTQGAMIEHFISEAEWSSKDKILIAEVGVFLGRSIAIYHEVLSKNNIPHEIIGIDHFNGSPEHQSGKFPMPSYESALNNLKDIKEVKLVRAASLDEVNNYSDHTFDMVYIDASHEYEPVYADIQAWMPKVKKGGFLCGDDYSSDWIGVINAVNELLPNRKIIASTQWFVRL